MNRRTITSKEQATSRRIHLLALGLLLAGCSTPSGTQSGHKPGSGLVEYREIIRQAHRSLAATVSALEALAPSHPALADFDRALRQLELTSVKARARAEAIIARGQAYFDEWKEQLAGITNQTAARVETERYSRFFEHFERIRQRSGEVREQFRPFMAKLREFRARLDQRPNEFSRNELDTLIASGRGVLRALESVSAGLDEAEAELHASGASKGRSQ